MIVHVLDEEKFVNKTIKIFNEIFPGRNVYLIGTDNENTEIKNFLPQPSKDIVYIPKRSVEYINYFKSQADTAELIFFHNLYKDYKLKLTPLLDDETKVVWYIWGAELYGLHPKINNLLPITEKIYKKSLPPRLFLRKMIFSKIKKHWYWFLFKKMLLRKVDFMVTNILEDMDLLHQYVPNIIKRGWFTYFSFDIKLNQTDILNEKNNILVGNSSSETNNHFDTFELLKKKHLGNKKIYLPLSYGDMRYRKTIVSKAKAYFGENSVPITDFLDIIQYNAIISSCSVLIMNHKRQQAFNTIMMAISNGCKIFLREENTIYSCLKREGFVVHSIQRDFTKGNALDSLTIEERIHNNDLCTKLYSYTTVKKKIKAEILNILGE